MALYVPGTEETDSKKQNQSLQLLGAAISTLQTLLAKITASLGADTAISNSVYSDGPSVAQGTTGTWLASGTVTFTDTVGPTEITAKLWDGTTVIASCRQHLDLANAVSSLSLSGYLAAPAGNIRISCTSNAAGATSTFKFNSSGNSKDCTISAIRIA